MLSNGSCYVSGDLKEFLAEQSITHVRGKPLHPQTQGKIERYHRTMKNIVKLEHYYRPEELEAHIDEFVDYYNNQRYHESLNNLFKNKLSSSYFSDFFNPIIAMCLQKCHYFLRVTEGNLYKLKI
jgi:transposase InsO family protein